MRKGEIFENKPFKEPSDKTVTTLISSFHSKTDPLMAPNHASSSLAVVALAPDKDKQFVYLNDKFSLITCLRIVVAMKVKNNTF